MKYTCDCCGGTLSEKTLNLIRQHVSKSDPAPRLNAPAVTEEMLTAAMKKAVEVGLLAGYCSQRTYLKNWDGMKKVLEAALGI